MCGQAGWCEEHEACEWIFSSVGMQEYSVGSVRGQAGWCVEHEACEWTFSSVGMHGYCVGSVCGQAGWCVEHEACEWTFSSVGMHGRLSVWPGWVVYGTHVVCVCVCARALAYVCAGTCVRACVRVCVRASTYERHTKLSTMFVIASSSLSLLKPFRRHFS